MSKPAEFCRIIVDSDDSITKWICRGLGTDTGWIGQHRTVGFIVGDKLAGGLICHDIRPGQDLWWTIYTVDKRWCSRRSLRAVFGLAFNFWQVRRINLLIDTDNFNCLKLVERLGFKREGLLRSYRENGADCYFMGLLKSERKF